MICLQSTNLNYIKLLFVSTRALPHSNTVSWSLSKGGESKLIWIVIRIEIIRIELFGIVEIVVAVGESLHVHVHNSIFGNHNICS